MKLTTFKALLASILKSYSFFQINKVANSLVNAGLMHVSVLAMSKEEHMVDAILKAVKSKNAAKAMSKAAPSYLSIHPCEVERLLNCSTPERKKLFDRGYLSVGYEGDFKYGYVRYATLDSMAAVMDKFDNIKQRFEKEKAKNRKAGAQKAAKTRKQRMKLV
ncbi:TPA: hypothetical protein JG855_004199 [Vibrio parahaemolyticus]|uniref:hypothetical protein n=2 Tax=Vibrio parahaemolyticus TaxID=670 RepID=UPI00111EE7C1|nr:hypothetical protein [Vibrio parahaemolyticus]EJV0371035.1 hypothetical protein [Vibrio vulnificus]EGQ9919319.1 hypothetical protein [Vibrio parahaemolyticus]MDF4357886.1 hypothetical protein [Vibrio parahaemolyticus]MDF4545101.1 hypothetical protein [Vibrio parahaemolyticus]MDG2580047.1 hypothetical protein [Vibrio parahaemolyticus]